VLQDSEQGESLKFDRLTSMAVEVGTVPEIDLARMRAVNTAVRLRVSLRDLVVVAR
jgi:hypothetical protein